MWAQACRVCPTLNEILKETSCLIIYFYLFCCLLLFSMPLVTSSFSGHPCLVDIFFLSLFPHRTDLPTSFSFFSSNNSSLLRWFLAFSLIFLHSLVSLIFLIYSCSLILLPQTTDCHSFYFHIMRRVLPYFWPFYSGAFSMTTALFTPPLSQASAFCILTLFSWKIFIFWLSFSLFYNLPYFFYP